MGMVSTSAKYGWRRCISIDRRGSRDAVSGFADDADLLPQQGRSVPEFLKVRFGEPTRVFNALSFAVLTVLVSGVGLYAMALILQVILDGASRGCNGDLGRFLYWRIPDGRLRATMYNECCSSL